MRGLRRHLLQHPCQEDALSPGMRMQRCASPPRCKFYKGARNFGRVPRRDAGDSLRQPIVFALVTL